MIDSSLLSRINGRRVIIDACVSRDLANGLRNAGLVVRHVADINSALKDQEIAMMMHADEVLITRDQRFYRMLGHSRAILLASGSNAIGRGDKQAKRKNQVRRKSRLPSHIRMALKEKLAEEARTGLLYMKILWGIVWLML
ncbi:MAG: DUF5615 family PIN-like protein [Thermoproteota archaeon]